MAVRLKLRRLRRKLPPDASLGERLRAGFEALNSLRLTAEKYRAKLARLRELEERAENKSFRSA